MPRFFSDIPGDTPGIDYAGVELASLEMARIEATRLAGRMLLDEPELLDGSALWRLTDRAERNRQVLAVPSGGRETLLALSTVAERRIIRNLTGA